MESWCRKIGTYQAKLELLAIEEEDSFDPGAGVGRVERHRADPADLRPRDPVPGLVAQAAPEQHAADAEPARRGRRAHRAEPARPGRAERGEAEQLAAALARGGSRRGRGPASRRPRRPSPGRSARERRRPARSVSAAPARRTVTPSAGQPRLRRRRRPQRGRVRRRTGPRSCSRRYGPARSPAPSPRRRPACSARRCPARRSTAGCRRAAPRRAPSPASAPSTRVEQRPPDAAPAVPRVHRDQVDVADARVAVRGRAEHRAHDQRRPSTATKPAVRRPGAPGSRSRRMISLRLGRVLRQVERLAAERDHGRQASGSARRRRTRDPRWPTLGSRPRAAACTAAYASTSPAPVDVGRVAAAARRRQARVRPVVTPRRWSAPRRCPAGSRRVRARSPISAGLADHISATTPGDVRGGHRGAVERGVPAAGHRGRARRRRARPRPAWPAPSGVGPRLENAVTRRSLVDRADGERRPAYGAGGSSIEPQHGPVLPAAATKKMPAASSASTAGSQRAQVAALDRRAAPRVGEHVRGAGRAGRR